MRQVVKESGFQQKWEKNRIGISDLWRIPISVFIIAGGDI